MRWTDTEDRMSLVRAIMMARREGRDLGAAIALWIRSFISARLEDFEVQYELVAHNLVVRYGQSDHTLSVSLGDTIDEILKSPNDCQFEFLFVRHMKIVASTKDLEAAIDWLRRGDLNWRRRVANCFLTHFQDYFEDESIEHWAVQDQRSERKGQRTSQIYLGVGYYELHFQGLFREKIDFENYPNQFASLLTDLQDRIVYMTTWIAPFQIERPVSLGIFRRMVLTSTTTVPNYSAIEGAVTDVDGDVILRRHFQNYRDRLGSPERIGDEH